MQELQNDDLRGTVQFHGHLCPGLALGYRVAKAALLALETERPQDEELVAVVENNSCAVDAIQFIAGCTFGKGNLIFHDYGKHVYTFYNRRTGKGVRVSENYRGFDEDPQFGELKKRQEAGEEVSRDMEMVKMKKTVAILKADETEIMTLQHHSDPPPEKARMHGSLRCSRCGEKFMESQKRQMNGAILCIPCSQNTDQ